MPVQELPAIKEEESSCNIVRLRADLVIVTSRRLSPKEGEDIQVEEGEVSMLCVQNFKGALILLDIDHSPDMDLMLVMT